MCSTQQLYRALPHIQPQTLHSDEVQYTLILKLFTAFLSSTEKIYINEQTLCCNLKGLNKANLGALILEGYSSNGVGYGSNPEWHNMAKTRSQYGGHKGKVKNDKDYDNQRGGEVNLFLSSSMLIRLETYRITHSGHDLSLQNVCISLYTHHTCTFS